MRLRIEADPGELPAKSDSLAKALADALLHSAPDLADALQKALPEKLPELRFPVLKELHSRTKAEYDKQLRKMLDDIGKVLDGSFQKSLQRSSQASVQNDLQKGHGGNSRPGTGAGGFGFINAPGKDDEKPEKEEGDSEKLEPGDYNPKTDDIVPEPPEAPEPGEEKEEPEEKSEGADPSIALAQADARAYGRVRSVLKRKGYVDADFDDAEGPLYGRSVNELIDMARDGG